MVGTISFPRKKAILSKLAIFVFPSFPGSSNVFIHNSSYNIVKVIVAFDGSEPAEEALKFTLKMSKCVTDVTVLYVTPAVLGTAATFDSYVPPSVYQKQDETAAGIIERARKLLEGTSIKIDLKNIDSAGDQVARSIVKFAESENFDLIVTGTRGLSGLSKLILGSVSSEVVKISRIPVLICPHAHDDEPDTDSTVEQKAQQKKE